MKLSTPEIYQLASEINEKEYNNLFNGLTEKESTTHKFLVKMGDSKEVALWTIISERYNEDNVEFYRNAYLK